MKFEVRQFNGQWFIIRDQRVLRGCPSWEYAVACVHASPARRIGLSGYRRYLQFVTLAILVFSTSAFADKWTYFYPETVTTISCSAKLVSEGDSRGVYFDKWEAEAKAKRNDPSLGDWAMNIAQYPATQKGRHQAEKACSQWFDEASKLIQKAHK